MESEYGKTSFSRSRTLKLVTAQGSNEFKANDAIEDLEGRARRQCIIFLIACFIFFAGGIGTGIAIEAYLLHSTPTC